MSANNMDSSAVYNLFEEIKDKLDKRAEQKSAPTAPSAPAIRPEDLAEIREMTVTLKETADAVRLPQQHIHKHTLDFMSNRALIVVAAVVVALLVSLWIVRNQRGTINQYRDNDLKYRYIQMKGQATTDDILMLRQVFDFNRNTDSIRLIRRRVERYEQLIQQQAETEARAKLNAQQAKQIEQEVNKLR